MLAVIGLAPQGRASVGGMRALLWLPVLVGLAMVLEMEMAGAAESVESNTAGTESPETVSPDLSRVSPQSSWLFFRKNSNKGDNKRSKPSKRVSKHGLPGPPGPPGPQGPPGAPAPLLPQQEQLIEDLHLKLKEMAGGVCTLCDTSPRVSTAFHSRLQRSLAVPRRSLLELQPYSQPSDSEQRLQRGLSFNSSTGRYTAPLAGFYQLTASLLIEAGDRVHTRQRDSVRASICIESLCQGNVSVESVTGLGSNGGVFSILLTGTLYLQAGEYVSVFVDNGTGSAISVLQDSLFSGILLGV